MAVTWNFAYCLLFFNTLPVGTAAGANNAFIGWSVLIIFALVFVVLLVILFFNPEFAWVCWYCVKDLVKKCCPNLSTSQCRGSSRPERERDAEAPSDDEAPPPYEEVISSHQR